MRQPGGISKSTTTLAHRVRDWVSPRRMEQSTVQEQPWAYSSTVTQRLPHAELQPGESRVREEYRPKRLADLGVPFAWSAIFGAACAGIAHVAGGNALGWFCGMFALSFLLIALPEVLAGGSNVVTLLEEMTRLDLNGDGQIGTIAVDLMADVKTARGGTRKTKATIPLAQVRAWRAFCQDVTAERCRFSGTAYEEHGGDRAVFDQIVQSWASGDPVLALVDPLSVGERKTPKLAPLGEKTIAIHAGTPLDDLLSSLLQITEPDRTETEQN